MNISEFVMSCLLKFISLSDCLNLRLVSKQINHLINVDFVNTQKEILCAKYTDIAYNNEFPLKSFTRDDTRIKINNWKNTKKNLKILYIMYTKNRQVPFVWKPEKNIIKIHSYDNDIKSKISEYFLLSHDFELVV